MSDSGTSTVEAVLAAFLDDLDGRLPAPEFEAVIRGEAGDPASSDPRALSDSFAEATLVFPLLGAAGLDCDPRPYGSADNRSTWPDFAVTDLGVRVVGERTGVNGVEEAIPRVEGYLDRKSIGADYGVATDGVEWYVYGVEPGGDAAGRAEIGHVDLRPALLALARERGLVDADALDGVDADGLDRVDADGLDGMDADEAFAEFVDVFERDAFEERLSRTAPRMLRDERRRDVEAFYDRYVGLLFGEGEEFDSDTCLLDGIRSPPGVATRDEQLFGVTLLNRLLFVRFLETRGVLDEGFLRERLRHYREHGDDLAGDLYESQVRPLFYDLLCTPESDRKPEHRRDGTWFTRVPYLNGGLFRERVPGEQRYGVSDRVLDGVVGDLVEGGRLDPAGRDVDPSVVGSVFERTIDHVEQKRTQRDAGAYYTPGDVTEIVVEGSVDPKIKDVLVETFVETAADGHREAVRSRLAGMDLRELLRQVEKGEGRFGDAEAVRAAKERLGELAVLDPACGSGHFLTTAMDEIHRAQVALLRGLNDGDDPDDRALYEAKETLALDCIYGVDVDEVAVEIAKLRVWLKVIEGNGWRERFGPLPNVDANVATGNSLVGLPTTGTDDGVDAWSEGEGKDESQDEGDGIREIEERRLEYKAADAGDPRELERFVAEEVRPGLDERYLQLFSRPVETEMDSVDEFDGVVGSIETGNLSPTIASVRARRADGEALSDDQQARLSAFGFAVHAKSARLDVRERESELERQGGADGEAPVDGLRGLLADGFVFSEVERRPTAYDLDRVPGTPFHWPAEFPEVLGPGRDEPGFDVVLTNPPYGDLLGDGERALTRTYRTAGMRDVSANFVERQLRLLAGDGYLGNVTTLRLVYQRSARELHDLLRAELGSADVACFGSRPSRVFADADVKAAVVTGGGPADEGALRTSDAIVFTPESRRERLENVEYGRTDGLVLNGEIGGTGGETGILPKVGSRTKRRLLETLAGQSGTLLADRYSREEPGRGDAHVVYRRRGVRYWVNPMLEELYSASEVEPMYFASELERDGAFLVLSSSLFYVYWVTYADFHHLNWSHVDAFPFPETDALAARAGEVHRLARRVWDGMRDCFDPEGGRRGEFHPRPLKPAIDEVDELLAGLYGLDADELAFVRGYLADRDGYGRAGPEADEGGG